MKKIILLLCLIIAVLPAIPVSAQDGLTLSLSHVENVSQGDEVVVDVNISNNPGVTGLKFTPEYDKTKMEFVGIDFSSKTSIFASCTKADTNDQVLCFTLGESDEDGNILGLKFKISDNAESGKSSVSISIAVGDMKNSNNEELKPVISAGYISIKGQDEEPPVVLPTSITLNPSGNASVTVGDNLQLTATVLPENAADKTVRWESSNPSAAAVDANGLVTGVSAGTVTITVTSNADRNVTAQISVNVEDKVNPPIPEPQPERDSRPSIDFFRLGGADRPLPRTGFSSLLPQALPAMPLSVKYEPMSWSLEIPSLSVSADLVEVPFVDGEYPITWLGSSVGLLEGFANPGEGYSVLTGHNHLNTMQAGPFAYLLTMEKGERIFLHDANDNVKIYVVYANEKVSETDYEAVEQIATMFDNSITMITCEDETLEGGYANRRIVAAKPLTD